jgi:uncharacterized protein (DUF1800 family)
MPKYSRFGVIGVLACLLATFGCGGGSTTAPNVLVTVPSTETVRLGDPAVQFSATQNGTATTAVTWSAGGVIGGNTTVGTISAAGLFTPPASLPSPNIVTVEAVSTTDATLTGQSTVMVDNPIPVVTSVNPPTVGVGTIGITITGSNFVSGAIILFGGQAITPTSISPTSLTASITTTAAQAGTVVVTVQNPDPGQIVSTTSADVLVTTGQVVTAAAAARFLEQSTFGPTPALITQVQQIGFAAFLANQFSAPSSTYPDPAAGVNTLQPTQEVLFTNALNDSDQLRQRVAFALSEIWVTSGFTVPPQGMAPYMRLLLQDAFGNYRTNLMNDVTLSPAMGRYLDMVNNDKPSTNPVTHANENYARELMQLFTLGLDELNEDGTQKLDSSNNPIPTYDQNSVQAFARAFTGWTYPTQPGGTLQKHNPAYWLGPMEAFDANHDVAAKTLLPVNGSPTTLPAGQNSVTDLNGALDNIFAQSSMAPFVSKQLIQHLVTSNPSTAYVRRVATVFDKGTFSGSGATVGSGQRGDLQAVIAAILLDPEARRGDDPTMANAGDGHLREPILFIANILRAFGAVSDGAGPAGYATNMSQAPLDSPSVFNFFPPSYNIPGTNLLGPEFDLETAATTLVRANFVNSFVYGSIGAATTVDFTTYANLSTNPNATGQLLDALNTLLMHSSLSASARASIVTAVNAVPAGTTQNLLRAKAAIYLILSSSQYQVEH